jgi:adenylate cyclase
LRIHEFPIAFLVVDPGTDRERVLPIHDRITVGRDCSGVEADRRLLVDDPAVSRTHLELRLDEEQDRAYILDMSTNGTRVNGSRIERAASVPIRPGDRILVGHQELEFRSDRFAGAGGSDPKQTAKNISLTQMAMVVGDIITYSTISEYTDSEVLMGNLGRLYGDLCEVLAKHHGTLNNYVGDAFFAIWELDHNPNAAQDAVNFALDADKLVDEISPSLDLRDPDGKPIRMGWAVAQGLVAVSSMTGMLVAVLGDATNLVFRISGLAGRDGRGDVLVTEAVRDATSELFRFEDSEEVTVKGRKASERIFAANSLDGS